MPWAKAVAEVLRTEQSMKWESNATGYYDLARKNLGLVGIVIPPKLAGYGVQMACGG